MSDFEARISAVVEQLRQIEADLRASSESAWMNVTIDAYDGNGRIMTDHVGTVYHPSWDSSGCSY